MFEDVADTGPAGFLAAVTGALAKLPGELWRTGNEGFADIAAAMDAVAVQVDCARVALIQEAQSRGVVDASPSSSPADWLVEHSLHLEPGDASRIVKLARACNQPKNQIMAAAVAGGTLSVRKAATALHQLAQVEDDLAPGKREEALASLTQMAQTGYNVHVIAIGRMLMALLGAEGALERNEEHLTRLTSLRLTPLENGMLRISGQLHPEAGAVLRAALDPLSAPHPTAAGGPDHRLADRRRADALIEIARRATAAGGAAPATTKAQIVVLIDHDALTGAIRGAGLTLEGAVLSPQAVRKLACDAAIIPIVLGSESQPLDVGRTKRLVTPALLAALWARDKGCTFPHCGRPPQWCDAHHIKHWASGGATALSNLGLLCGYHHTFVHQHNLTATITDTTLTWQTTLPQNQNPWSAAA